MDQTIRFILNGKPVSLSVDGERMLLWVLRTDLGLTGTKFGCGKSLCGACTVIVDDEAVRSCVVPVKDVAGKKVLTIEGLARDGRLHPLQEAFMKHDALQCGYCTPGMILTAYSLLLKNPEACSERYRGRPELEPVPLRGPHPHRPSGPGCGRDVNGRSPP